MNYYNEFDQNAAAWLRELIARGLIPPGEVDERSIANVTADDLRGFTQCHFFAGIAGWSYALQLAGWDAERPVWTGSCPCQAFSTAGKQKGFDDERDLWPAFFNLIKECRPEYVFGEQVENAIKHGWLDRVYRDMEKEGYSCGSIVLGAHSIGSPHQRQRLYWGCTLAAIPNADTKQCHRSGQSRQAGGGEPANGSNDSRCIPHAPCKRCSEERSDSKRSPERSSGSSAEHALAKNSNGGGCGRRHNGNPSGDNRKIQTAGLCGDSDRLELFNSQLGKEQCKSKPNETQQSGLGLPVCINNIPWERYQLIYCQDGAARRIPAESIFFSLADGVYEGVDGSGNDGISEVDGFPLTRQKEGCPMLLKGYGNAIVPQVAAEFIKAFEISIEEIERSVV
jgi:DNA (cytosine-5)-methyltransferase 1